MNRYIKLGAIAIVLAAIAVLLYIAVSSSLFFVDQRLIPNDAVYEEDDGYAFHFYKEGIASDEKSVKMATFFHSIGAAEGDIAPVLFKVIPREGYKLDSLHLELNLLQPTSALMLEDPGFDYQRNDHDSTIVLDFPGLDLEPSETVMLYFWLDLAVVSPTTPEQLLLDIALTMHETSILKIVKYSAGITIQLAVPSIA
jgi:hypothetical protein